ncbi:MAG TPA: SMP-30/gluconolactonase/LRE family protein [Gemmatimonadaceae bacterium]|jgi:sugar lactone lactonase YvrE
MTQSIPLSRLVVALSALVLAGACKTEKTTPQDTSHPAAAATTAAADTASAKKLDVLAQMKTPESVHYDADLDVWFISNINGNPSQHDGNGYIVRVPAESTMSVTMFAESGKNGVRMDAPKGIATTADQLWVTDIDVVRVFDKRTGKPIKTISLKPEKATFLNDAVVGPDSAVYITDTGIVFDAKGGMTHPGVNRIFRIALSDNKVTEAATGDALESPNGITWDAANNRYLLAPFQGKDMQSWTPGQAPMKIADGPGQYDGIEVLKDGRILISSWADSTVNVVRDGVMSKLVTGVSAPADIGVDSKRGILAIPRFDQNQVEFWKLP